MFHSNGRLRETPFNVLQGLGPASLKLRQIASRQNE